MTLHQPTVIQVIQLLQTMAPDAPFRIDTVLMQGREDIVHIDTDAVGYVWISGDPEE